MKNRLIIYFILILSFSALFPQNEMVSDKDGENNDSLLQLRKKYLELRDSLYIKKKKAIKQVESNIEKFTNKRFSIKNYKKEELVANLIYKLAYYYHGLEEKEQIDIGERLDLLYDDYYDKFELQDSVRYKAEYLSEIRDMAPSLLENYEEERLILEQPGGLYKGEFKKTLEYYKKIIYDYPTSSLAPNAYYNIAYILYDMDRKDEAIDVYKKIIESYPTSDFYIDANFALGEYYFDPALNPDRNNELDLKNVNTAIDFYKAILDVNIEKERDIHYYYKSLFRLGFCYYRIYEFMKSADYLTKTIEELYEKYGLKQLPNDMRDISFQFLAFSFKDNAWDVPDTADVDLQSVIELKNYILNRKQENYTALYIYGNQVLNELGNAYFEGEDYNQAIAAYDTLLSMYPTTKEAPRIQEKIISAHELKNYDVEDQRNDDLYRERNELYAMFNPDTKWAEKNLGKRDSLGTDTLLAKYLYQNIMLKLELAQKTDNKKVYETTLEHVDQYVYTLPNDTNTYKLKWWKAKILDKRLESYLDAYNMYIEISRDSVTKSYFDSESNTRFTDTLAARGAISVAQLYSKTEESAQPDTVAIKDTLKLAGKDLAEIKKQKLSRITIGEQKQIDAFKNYAGLFPDTKEAREYLFNAALIYHKNKDYDSNKPLLYSIIERYPATKQEYESYKMLYSEYFEENNFAKAEEITRKMENLAGLSEEEKQEIIRKKGDAAYKFAEAEIKSAETIETTKTDTSGNIVIDLSAKFDKLKNAADNFMRTARQNPNYEFADQSVWNAASYYAQAKEWDSVVVAYDYLISNFDGKKNKEGLELAAIALFKKAYIYTDTVLTKYPDYSGPLKKSIKDNNNSAAKILESFAAKYPDFRIKETDVTQNAVADAAWFYKEGEDWKSAIRMNRKYLDLYGSQREEKENIERYRDIARFYRKLGQIKETIKIFDELGRKYPNDPFAVEGYYERAQYYLEQNNLEQAGIDFTKCYETSKRLQDKGIEKYGKYYASEALFTITEWDREKYFKINLNDGSRERLKSLKGQKVAELKRLGKQYQNIINLYSKEFSIASIRQAQIAENYADIIFNQKRFTSGNIVDDLGTEEGLNEEAKTAYNKSIELYTSAIKSMDEFINVYSKLHKKQIDEINAAISKDSTNAELLTKKRKFESDSTIRVSKKLKEEAKESVLRMQYTLANVYKNLAKNYSSIQPDDLNSSIEALSYYEEMKIFIEQMSAPKVKNIIEAHQKNLVYAREFNMLNNKWVLKSKYEIARSAEIITQAYLDLAEKLIDLYKITDKHIININSKKIRKDEDDFPVPSKTRIDGEMNDVTYAHEKMGTVVEEIGGMLSKSIESYDNNLLAGKDNLKKVEFDKLKEEYLENILTYGNSLDSLVVYATNRQNSLNLHMEINNDLRDVYNDYADEFLEAYKDQVYDIREAVNELYEIAFEKIKEYRIKNRYTSQIYYSLLNNKPADYFEEFGFSTKNMHIKSDYSWKAISAAVPGWYSRNTDTSFWLNPDSVELSTDIENDSVFTRSGSVPIWTHYEAKFDSLLPPSAEDEEEEDYEDEEEGDEEEKADSKMFILRKDFDVSNIPTNSRITLTIDGMFGFFINGISQFDMVLKDDKDSFDLVFDNDDGKWNRARTWDISEFIKKGNNSVVIYVVDTDSINYGVMANIDVSVIDSDITSETKLRLKSEKDDNSGNAEVILERKLIRIFRKNKLD